MMRRLRSIARRSPLAGRLLSPITSSYGRMWDVAAINGANARWWMGAGASEDGFELSGQRDADLLRQLIRPTDRVLDLGCGVGRVMRYLAPHCSEVHGVDVSSRMLSRARVRLRGLSNVYLHRTGGHDLRALGDAIFDFVFALQVFHHLEREHTMRYLSELCRVLRPGGGVYLQFLSLEVTRLAEEFHDYALESATLQAARRRYFTEQEVRTYTRLAGFLDVDVRHEGDWLLVQATTPAIAPARETATTEARA